jgi:hypothetical protein
MELLCPNCQQKLTVPEQYAGQLMRCPLCQGTFTVPALPSSAPPGEGGVSFGSFGSPPAPPPKQEGYGLVQEPPPATPPPVTPPPTRSPFEEIAAEPARRPEPPTQPAPPAPPQPTEGYSHIISCCLNPKVLGCIAPGALFVVFITLFFTWVQTFEVKEWYTQSGWGTGFGSEGSGWGIVYILFLFPTFFLAVASAVLPFIPAKFPPQVEKLLPWRPAVVAGAILFTFLFLLVQIWPFGFGLENVVATPPKLDEAAKPEDSFAGRIQKKDEYRLRAQMTLERTGALRLAVLLQLVAAATAGLELWVLLRGPTKPLPRIDMSW